MNQQSNEYHIFSVFALFGISINVLYLQTQNKKN